MKAAYRRTILLNIAFAFLTMGCGLSYGVSAMSYSFYENPHQTKYALQVGREFSDIYGLKDIGAAIEIGYLEEFDENNNPVTVWSLGIPIMHVVPLDDTGYYFVKGNPYLIDKRMRNLKGKPRASILAAGLTLHYFNWDGQEADYYLGPSVAFGMALTGRKGGTGVGFIIHGDATINMKTGEYRGGIGMGLQILFGGKKKPFLSDI